MRLSVRIPEQLKLPVAKDDAAVPANEALLIFIRLPLPLHEFRISPSAVVTILLGDNRVPLVQSAQLFSGIVQHFVKCAIREMLVGVNLIDADPDLCSFENRAKELLAFSQFLLGLFFLGDVFC